MPALILSISVRYDEDAGFNKLPLGIRHGTAVCPGVGCAEAYPQPNCSLRVRSASSNLNMAAASHRSGVPGAAIEWLIQLDPQTVEDRPLDVDARAMAWDFSYRQLKAALLEAWARDRSQPVTWSRCCDPTTRCAEPCSRR